MAEPARHADTVQDSGGGENVTSTVRLPRGLVRESAPGPNLNAEYGPDERDVAAVMLAVATGQKTVFIGANETQAKAVFAEAKRRLAALNDGTIADD